MYLQIHPTHSNWHDMTFQGNRSLLKKKDRKKNFNKEYNYQAAEASYSLFHTGSLKFPNRTESAVLDRNTKINNSEIYVSRLFHNLLTYGRTEQHAVFTYQTSNTPFIDAPEDGPVGPKHVEPSNIL